MSNISDIRTHMKSIRQTVKISAAQKLIAGAHIMKARRLYEQSLPFHDRIQRTMALILGDSATTNKYFDTRNAIKKRGLLVISADRGLAGGYNHDVMKLALQTMREKPVAKLLVIGHIGYEKFAQMDVPLDHDLIYSVQNPTMHTAREISEHMINMFENEEVDSFDVVYTHYRSAFHMVPSMERLFPLSLDDLSLDDPEIKPVHFSEYGSSPEEILEVLIPKYLKGFLFGCLAQAWICELNSRVNAMESAIKNGNEMLRKLSLKYNRVRQSAITQEITEIVAGAASMEEEDEL
jgi:F-type H+-transporting ATPase subunit gamma